LAVFKLPPDFELDSVCREALGSMGILFSGFIFSLSLFHPQSRYIVAEINIRPVVMK
jgi:hypothetical protein